MQQTCLVRIYPHHRAPVGELLVLDKAGDSSYNPRS